MTPVPRIRSSAADARRRRTPAARMGFAAVCVLLGACRPAAALATLSQEDPVSPRIAALEGEFASRGREAISAFREELRREGAPLVESLPGAPTRVLITFVWFAEGSPSNVVVQSWLHSRSLERRTLVRLGESSLWYRTFEAPSDLTMGYLMSPDDARLRPGDAEGDVTATWQPDPLNPDRARGALNLVWSVVSLPDRHPAPWMDDTTLDVPPDRLSELDVAAPALGADVRVKVVVPPGFDEGGGDAYPLLLFFDGFGYWEIDQVHRLIERLTRDGRMRPTVTAYLYSSQGTRNRDMSCHEPMHRFLRDELIPMLRERVRAGRDPRETVLVGRSRSGLGAVCASFSMPDVIGGAISQSGSFWWSPEGEETEWLARQFAERPRVPIRLYLDAGELESEPNPELGLSMLTVTRHLRDVVRAKGYELHYREFPGGHDPIGWRTRLPEALEALLGT